MLNKILSKLAAEQPIDPAAAQQAIDPAAAQQAMPETPEMYEAAESPEMEAAEHAPGGYEEGEQALEGEGAGGDELAQIEQMISQLSPEELHQLTQELSGESAAAEGGDDTAALAQAIEGHLSETPEASAPQAPEEKQAALAFVKSASYIHGFLKHAADQGVSVNDAVDLYDSALTQAIHDLKVASLKGNQTKKADMQEIVSKLQGLPQQGAEALRGVADQIDPGFLEQLKAQAGNAVSGAGNFMQQHGIDPSVAAALGGGAALGAGGMGLYNRLTQPKQEEEEMKMASYYDGLFERAAEYGLSPDETIKLAGWFEDMKNKASDMLPSRAGIPGAIGGPSAIPGRMPKGQPVSGGTAKAK